MTLTELCQELRNWFVKSKYFGTFSVEGGEINVSDLVADGSLHDGQYYRIIGSVFSDGVHKYGDGETLTDEVFEGAIWAMAVPPAVIELSERIDEWETKYGESVSSPYASESFGGYSYTKAGAGQGNANSNANPTWQSTFASELNRWRKI